MQGERESSTHLEGAGGLGLCDFSAFTPLRAPSRHQVDILLSLNGEDSLSQVTEAALLCFYLRTRIEDISDPYSQDLQVSVLYLALETIPRTVSGYFCSVLTLDMPSSYLYI